MSINEENMEIEFINQRSKERNAAVYADEAALEYAKLKTRKAAVKKLWLVVMAVFLAMVLWTILETVSWISTTFYVVLLAITGGVGMFKAGYIWCQINN